MTGAVGTPQTVAESGAAHPDLPPDAAPDAIPEAAPDAVLVVDRVSGTILAVNDAALSMFGYAGEELIGQPIPVVIPSGGSAGRARCGPCPALHPTR